MDRNQVCICGKFKTPFPSFGGSQLWPELCPDCADRLETARLERERGERVARLSAAANLPDTARDWDMDRAAVGARPGFEMARYWQYSPEGLYLYGPVGVGKSVLVQCLLKRQIEDHLRNVLYLKCPLFLETIRRQTVEGRALADAAVRADVLVLDDLGAERPTDWVRERIFCLIDERIDARRPIIYTSNLSPGDLWRHLGGDVQTERITDRIMGSCRVVRMTGESFRDEVATARREEQTALFGERGARE